MGEIVDVPGEFSSHGPASGLLGGHLRLKNSEETTGRGDVFARAAKQLK